MFILFLFTLSERATLFFNFKLQNMKWFENNVTIHVSIFEHLEKKQALMTQKA